MEYVLAIVCAMVPLALGFWLNRRFGQRSERDRTSVPGPHLIQQTAEVSPEVGNPRGKESKHVVPRKIALTAQLGAVLPIATGQSAEGPLSNEPTLVYLPKAEREDSGEEAVTEFQAAGTFEKPKHTPVFVDLRHFERHVGVPGFLYLARNDERREHLYKIGYTTGLPQGRMKTLNEQVAGAVDIGTFRLVHCVPVGSSYDMEQALFAALAERRVIGEREFFYGPEKVFMRAMDALMRMPQDGGEAINDLLASNPWSDVGAPPPAVLAECAIPSRSNADGGWVYVCQNFWHRPGTSYYSVSKETPLAVVKRLNEAQRDFTSQLGFYRIVACRAVDSTETARQHAQLLFAPYRIDARKQFVRASLDVLRTIVESLNGGVAAPPSPRPKPLAQPPAPPHLPGSPPSEVKRNERILVDVVMGVVAPNTWAPWTARCDNCNTLLRFRGVIGEQANVDCPFCRHAVSARIGSTQVHIGSP